MSFVAVLPSIYQPWTDDCLASMRGAMRDHMHVFDNTVMPPKQ